MIRRHLEANRDRLSAAEYRAMLGARYALHGRNAYVRGRRFKGLSLLVKAIMYGHQTAPFGTL